MTETCGYTIGGNHVPRNSPASRHHDEATGSKLHETNCDCLDRFTAAITALIEEAGE